MSRFPFLAVLVGCQEYELVPDEVTPPDAPEEPAPAYDTGAWEPLLHDVDLLITADDSWDAWLDGVEFTAPNQDAWSYSDALSWELETGDHVLAVHGWDRGSVISGLIAVLSVDGVDVVATGDGAWRMSAVDPGTGWQAPGFDDGAWAVAQTCASQSIWGTYWPAEFYSRGASWVWWTPDCSDLQQAWFRLEFTLE